MKDYKRLDYRNVMGDEHDALDVVNLTTPPPRYVSTLGVIWRAVVLLALMYGVAVLALA
jgi:hypothetical protein